MTWFRPDSPALVLHPADCVTEEGLVVCVADQAVRLLDHRALYLYWLNRERTALLLRSVRTAPVPIEVRPDYAGLVADTGLSPVPLAVEPEMAGAAPRYRIEAGEHWVDLPVGPWLLLRYRLAPACRPPARLIAHLARWASASELAAARGYTLSSRLPDKAVHHAR